MTLPPAQAVTDQDGHYEVISVFDQGRIDQPGMMPGKYTVQITQPEKLRGGEMSRMPKNLLPKKYESAASGLAAEVVAGGDNVFNFDLMKHQFMTVFVVAAVLNRPHVTMSVRMAPDRTVRDFLAIFIKVYTEYFNSLCRRPGQE